MEVCQVLKHEVEVFLRQVAHVNRRVSNKDLILVIIDLDASEISSLVGVDAGE